MLFLQKPRLKKDFFCGVRERLPPIGMSTFKTSMSGKAYFKSISISILDCSG